MTGRAKRPTRVLKVWGAMARSRSIYAGGRKVAEFAGDDLVWHDPEYYAVSKRSDAVKAPMYMRDIGEYRSPIDGTLITSRSAHRDHVRQHDVIELGNEVVKPLPEAPISKDIGMAIKRRIDEVKAMPESTYRDQVQKQQVEHAEVAALVTAG